MRAGLLEQLALPVADDVLDLALVHRSWAYENGAVPTNERLEFLGDAVLGLVVTDELFHAHPDAPEGRLAKLRAAVVNTRALAGVARALGLGECVLLGRGEEATGGRDKDSILADTTEAVIGATYLSCGADAARDLVLRLVGPLLRSSAELGAGLDWKTSLQELAAAHALAEVAYRTSEDGPDHAKTFAAVVEVRPADQRAPAVIGSGSGRSKKEAEQAAAADAWRALSALAASGAAAGAGAAGTPVPSG